MATELKLKSCPFCGERKYLEIMKGNICHWWMRCMACLAEGPAKDRRRQAIAAWNKRVIAAHLNNQRRRRSET